MKKLILLFSLAISLMNFKPNAEEVVSDCETFAAITMAIHESENGCLSSEEYNAGYTVVLAICESIW